MTNLLYSAKHYQIKTAKEADRAKNEADRAELSAANAEEAKNLANEAVSKLGEFDSTVENAKSEIIELSATEQTTITNLSASNISEITTLTENSKTEIVSVAEENKNSAVNEINSTKSDAVNTVEQAGAVIANYQQPIVVISETSGTITLQSTKIYQIEITDAVSFVLPDTVNSGYFNQIKVMAKITGTPTIDWGTTQFFNKAIPEIEGDNYDIYFDYDNLLGAWVCGAMVKGTAE